MDDKDFEGTLVLEKLSAIDLLEEFFEAVDSDNFAKASELMRRAGVDPKTITMVLNKMSDADTTH